MPRSVEFLSDELRTELLSYSSEETDLLLLQHLEGIASDPFHHDRLSVDLFLSEVVSFIEKDLGGKCTQMPSKATLEQRFCGDAPIVALLLPAWKYLLDSSDPDDGRFHVGSVWLLGNASRLLDLLKNNRRAFLEEVAPSWFRGSRPIEDYEDALQEVLAELDSRGWVAFGGCELRSLPEFFSYVRQGLRRRTDDKLPKRSFGDAEPVTTRTQRRIAQEAKQRGVSIAQAAADRQARRVAGKMPAGDGVSVAEIAQALGKKTSTVRSKLTRLVKKRPELKSDVTNDGGYRVRGQALRVLCNELAKAPTRRRRTQGNAG